jgi:hypothetical protein
MQMTPPPSSPPRDDPMLSSPFQPSLIQQLHEDTFSACEDAWACPRAHHDYCSECHLSSYHSDQCVHLREYAQGLDYDG